MQTINDDQLETEQNITTYGVILQLIRPPECAKRVQKSFRNVILLQKG